MKETYKTYRGEAEVSSKIRPKLIVALEVFDIMRYNRDRRLTGLES